MVSRGTGPRSHGRVATSAAGGCLRLAVVLKFFWHGHSRHCASARCCNPGWSRAGAQPRSAWKDWCTHLGVLCLGSALAVLSIHAVTAADASRVIQGIVTGVGFLGAGVIVRSERGHHVQGLTTAAVVWVTACLGAACAVARWQIVVIGVVLVFVILVFGGPFEKAIDRRWPWRPMEVADRPPDTTGGNERES